MGFSTWQKNLLLIQWLEIHLNAVMCLQCQRIFFPICQKEYAYLNNFSDSQKEEWALEEIFIMIIITVEWKKIQATLVEETTLRSLLKLWWSTLLQIWTLFEPVTDCIRFGITKHDLHPHSMLRTTKMLFLSLTKLSAKWHICALSPMNFNLSQLEWRRRGPFCL